MAIQNFKGEYYPENIGAVLADMHRYIEQIEYQLNLEQPHNIRDFLSFGEKNTIGRKKFADIFGLNSCLSKKDKEKQFKNEIKGLYALAEMQEGRPVVINVGISQTIIRRFYQHTCGKNHNESTLGFYMALHKHKQAGKDEHPGKRKTFPYADYRDSCLEDIRNLRFAIIPIDNNFELYMAEVYLSCHYKAYWNTFETH